MTGGRASRELARRHLWGHVPSRPARRPDDRRRLALTFDLDYQADTDALPRLLQVLDDEGARASVVAVGALVDADADPYAEAVAAGHELVNHTLTHPDNPVLNPDREFWHLSPQQMTDEVGLAQDVFERRLGVRPVGFRTPHFKDAHRLTAVLDAFAELRYASSALASRTPLGGEPYLASAADLAGEDLTHLFAAADPGAAARVLQVPLTPCPAHRWTPFCSWHGIRAGAAPGSGAGMHAPAEWARLWDVMLRRAEPDGLAVVYLDPQDVVRDDATTRLFAGMLRSATRAGWDLVPLVDVEQAYRPLAAAAA